jgi:hypothetical protein
MGRGVVVSYSKYGSKARLLPGQYIPIIDLSNPETPDDLISKVVFCEPVEVSGGTVLLKPVRLEDNGIVIGR